MQPILDFCIFIELLWKSNTSYLATCPIKKQGGLSAIIIKVIDLNLLDQGKICMEFTVSTTIVKVLDFICSMGPPDLQYLPVPSN